MLKSVLIFLWRLLSGRDRKRQMVALGWDWAGTEQAERARVVERIVEVNMVQREDIRGRCRRSRCRSSRRRRICRRPDVVYFMRDLE